MKINLNLIIPTILNRRLKRDHAEEDQKEEKKKRCTGYRRNKKIKAEKGDLYRHCNFTVLEKQ